MSVRATIDGLGDGLNPVLVREVRQSLRSRSLHGTYAFALVAAMLTAFASVQLAGGRDGAGGVVFRALFLCFCLTVTVVFPLSTYGRLVAGSSDMSEQLALITRLTAGRCAVGRLEAALATLGLYLCAFVPFSTFAYLLHGLEWWVLLQGGIYVCAAGLVAASFSVLVATSVPRGAGSTLALVAGVAAGASATAVGGVVVWEQWTLHSACIRLLIAVVASWLMLSVSAARLSLAGENRETGLRIALAVLAVVLTATALVSAGGTAAVGVEVGRNSVGNLAVWGFLGCFMLAASDPSPAASVRWVPRRLLPDILFLPGRAGAFLFFVAVALLVAAPLVSVVAAGTMSWRAAAVAIVAPVCVAAVPSSVFGWTRRRWRWPRSHVLAAGIALGIVLTAMEAFGDGHDSLVRGAWFTGDWRAFVPVDMVLSVVGCFARLQTASGLLLVLPAAVVATAYYVPLVMRAVARTRERIARRSSAESRLLGTRKGRPARAARSRTAH